MEEKKIISLELKHHLSANNRNYYGELFVPASEGDILDTKQRLRCLFGEQPEVTVLGCSLVPELEEIRPVGTLLEYNALAKRLESLPTEEVGAFRALITKSLAENKYGMSVKDLINMTYGLDTIGVAHNIFTDEMLGAFVIENGMNDMVNDLPDEIVKLLDRSAVGMLQRKADSGFYCSRNYYILDGYKPSIIYDGVSLPEELMPDPITFQIAEDGSICSPIRYLNHIPVRTDKDPETLRKLKNIWNNMDASKQIAFKAILESEKPNTLEDCRFLAGCLRNYEFSYFSDDPDSFAKEYLRFHLPDNLQSDTLQRAPLYEFGTELLRKIGATVTDYGVISEADGILFGQHPSSTEENIFITHFDVVEVLGQKALYANWRWMKGEIPDGCYCYDVRADDGSPFGTLEPTVFVDYGGSLLVKQPIDFGEKGYIEFSEDTSPNFLGETMTVEEFANMDFTEDERMDMQL